MNDLYVEISIYENSQYLVEILDSLEVQSLEVVVQGVPDTGERIGDHVKNPPYSQLVERNLRKENWKLTSSCKAPSPATVVGNVTLKFS